MVGSPHNCGEITRCEELQKHVVYSSQGQIPVFLPFGSHEQHNCDMCSMRQLTGLMPTTVPVCFPDGWRVWFGTAICWRFGASDPRFSSLKEAMLSTDIIFTKYLPDVMLRNESVKVYELPTGFTLEATVSSSDSEITQWLLLHVDTYQRLSRCLLSFQALNRGYCRHVVKGSWLWLPACVRI